MPHSIRTKENFAPAAVGPRGVAVLLPLLLFSLAPNAKAQQFGDFSYSSNGSAVTITRYSGSGGGVTIPGKIGDLPVTSIGASSFQNRIGLTSIIIPGSVTSIGDGAFYGCTGLTSIIIPDSITFIGDSTFSNCTGLTSVTIPGSVTSIGDSTFSGCTALLNIHVAPGNPAYKSVGGVLFNLGETTLLKYPEGRTGSYLIPASVRDIGTYAFSGCTGLTGVTIPGSLTSIGNYSFFGCTGLTGVTTPDGVTSLGDYSFYGCTGLTSFTIPGSLTSIGNGTFSGCTGLISVTIPGSVTSIGVNTFTFCTGLTSVTIPDGVTLIGGAAFLGCTGLTSVTIPGSVTSIGNYAFHRCENLQNVIFKGNAPSLGENPFWEATPNFRVMTFPGSSGFSFPIWRGYSSIILSPIQQWRIAHFQTPYDTGTAADSGDPDGDGSVNLDEFTAGTLPTDAADVLRITSAARSGAAFTVTLPGKAGRSYQLLRGSDPSAASWESIATQGPAAAEGPVILTDPKAPAGRAFYRVAVSRP